MTTATRSAHDEAFGAALYRLLAAHGGNLVSPPTRQHRATLRVALCGARPDQPFLFALTRHGRPPLFPGQSGTG